MNSAIIADYEILTSYGMGTDALWHGLMSGRTAICGCKDIGIAAFENARAASCPLLKEGSHSSRLMRLLEQLFRERPVAVPDGTALILATTTGEIDLLERAVLEESEYCSSLTDVLPAVQALTGANGDASIISSACTSATAGLMSAHCAIQNNRAEAVLVVAVDGLSEFILSGFSSLMALDPDVARPFDRDRAGLSLGEAAGYMLLMSAEAARRAGRNPKGYLRGGGMTNDANHMTGPSRDGGGLARAISKALKLAHCEAEDVAFVAAHGTGTAYNDGMEMKAFKTVFAEPVPTFSIKGGIGHTMGNAGLAQTIVALGALCAKSVPPTVGCRSVDDVAAGWVSAEAQRADGRVGVVSNAGFGGINAAVVVEAVI